MAQPVYKLFMGKPSEAWYQLSQDEQNQLLVKVDEALTKAGGKRVVLCNSAWVSEQWHFWGVEQFPDMEALQRHSQLLDEFNWHRYGQAMTVLGAEWQ